MTVKEYALRQLHWLIQKDPWVQSVMLAGGITLDQMAERILTIYNSSDFSKLNLDHVRYYERILGLKSDEDKTLADRRSAIQAAWNVANKPSLSSIQAICDGWEKGGIIASYEPGTLTLKFIGAVGVPANVEDLKDSLERAVPAHLIIEYAYRYLLIQEVHETMTLEELEATPLSSFAGG